MFNPTYYLFALPALLLGLYAQYRVRSAYSRYQKVRNRHNITGYEAARKMMMVAGLPNIPIEEIPGQLSDHYDPRTKSLHLSAGVARSPSLAALGIVAHELGHALQDAEAYVPLRLRTGIVPVVQLGSWLGPIIFLLGMLIQTPDLALFGLVLFSATALFALVTLPVEFNASTRAVRLLTNSGLVVSEEEERGVRAVLDAAALTYVAAAVQALSTILYYVFLLGGFRRRD
ncbi:MAG: zinc metallopeptidase [Anaerolineae bacterium]|nr:zinc metallopeptidase [Anaerolineae bacterium]